MPRMLHLVLALLFPSCDPGDSKPHETAFIETGEPIPRGALQFTLPVRESDLITVPIVGVDHDPEVYEGVERVYCDNFNGDGFPWCYDEHDGSDFLLDGAFETMDAGSATVIAAAPGTVVDVEDGHYDRCHGDPSTMDISCDGNEIVGNHVILDHGGHSTLYWHFKNGSILVQKGQKVEMGAPLGLIGSSGYSSGPHLHFEVQDADETVIDPFAGPLSQPETWWCDQQDPDELPGACG